MSRIEQVREFVAKCPFLDDLTDGIHINWLDTNAADYGIIPTGESVISRDEDILGNVVITKQYNYGLVANRFTIDDVIRLENSGFLEDFTDWIDEQSQKRTFPFLGDVPEEESVTAQNGMLFQKSPNGQTGQYQIQVNHIFQKIIKQEEF